MHSSRSSELTVYKVSHGYLQHHHHHWRHHHRRHHNQHDVHQLFKSNSILRVPEASRSPPHAMPSFSSRDGLPLEDFRWLQLNTKVIRRLSLYSYSLSSFASTSFSMTISDDSSRLISAGATLLLVAFIVLHHPGLGVVTTLPRWCYVEDSDNCLLILRHVNNSPGFLVHRRTGFYLHKSGNVVSGLLMSQCSCWWCTCRWQCWWCAILQLRCWCLCWCCLYHITYSSNLLGLLPFPSTSK